MAIIKCKMCGGDLTLIEGQSVAECEYCGSRQTVPAADNEKKLNLFAGANKLRAACEFDRAAGIYDAVRAEFPGEAEAYWGLVLCKYGIEYVDDPTTGKKVPTCHRLSYDSVMDDANLDLAMEYADAVARKVYREEARHLEKIRTGILEVSSNEKPYDIFICYKETDENGDRTLDSVLAQNIYSALTDKGYRVFFSRITLQSKLGEAYEPYIFAALNSAKVMLAIGTDPEYYNAVWVKNEWSRYLKICAADKTRHLIPCYKDMDAYDMPREFRPLQGVDLGRMGAVQDILFNMEKYIPLKKDAAVIQEKVVVGGTGAGNKIASLLDRGNMALEDGDWAKADSFFEDVLNNDSKNAQAYIGKTLAQEKCRTMDALVRKRRDVYQNVSSEKLYIKEKSAHISQMEKQYSLSGYVEKHTIRELYRFDLSYTSEVSGRQKQYREEELWWLNHKLLSRAEKFAVGAVAEHLQSEKKHLFTQLNDRVKKAREADARSVARLEAAYDAHIAKADKQAEKIYNDGLCSREANYRGWLERAKKETDPLALRELTNHFIGLGDYQDSKNLAEHCRKRAAEEQAKIDAENERQRVIAEQKKKAQQKRKKIIAILSAAIVVLVIVVVLAVTKIIIPANNYKEAEALLENGKTAEAAMAFGAMGDYKDSWQRSFDLWDAVTVRKTIISANNYHTVGLKADGTVVAVGSDDYGRCDVFGWTDVIAVSAGNDHTIGLIADGTVMAVGASGYGQCDVFGWADIVAISAGGNHTVGLKANGTVVAVGHHWDNECEVSDWTNIVAISAGGHHTVGLKADGTVVAVGLNKFGQCAVSSWTDIVAISAGKYHTVGLKTDGTVVAVGLDEDGRCDVSGWKDIIAVSAGLLHTVGLKNDGTVVAVGDNDRDQSEVSDWTDIITVSAGYWHTVGLKADGSVIAVGNSDQNQCAVSSWTDIMFPKVNPEQAAVMAAARQEREAQLAAEQKAEEERLAKEYAAAEELAENGQAAKAAMAFYAMGDYQDARERCFELWDSAIKEETVSAGWFFTVGLKTDGTVIATGSNYSGQCNVSDWKNIVSISAGGYHTVGVRADGTVVAVGYDENNQLDVDGWTDITAVSAGGYHTVGLKGDGTVVATGMNQDGQCNVDDWTDIVAISAGAHHTVGLKADGTVLAIGYDDDGRTKVDNWTDIVAISAGNYHTAGLKSDGTIVAVGSNPDGQTDTENWTDVVFISAGGYNVTGIKSDGTAAAYGSNKEGQSAIEGWRDMTFISAGAYHTIGIRSDGTVVAVGNDEDGQCNVSGWKDIKLPT